MTEEGKRLEQDAWRDWGPYLANREWGVVREDYSDNGDAWNYTNHDSAESKTYRWGEEGLGGICDLQQKLVFAWGFWNGKDRMVKERFFGLSNPEGNHGEDVKEYYYYLDSTPTHSYMKMLYKYPQAAFPYDDLRRVNREAGAQKPEFELIDTGVFNENRYFDIFIEYAKASEHDMLIKLTAINRGPENAPLVMLPTLWYRNTWGWGYDDYKPELSAKQNNAIAVSHRDLQIKNLYADQAEDVLFCDNETNFQRLYGVPNSKPYTKDGINHYLLWKDKSLVNPDKKGTKAAFLIQKELKPGESVELRFRLTDGDLEQPFTDFDSLFEQRLNEANDFYADVQKNIDDPDKKLVQRQAFAGMLWNKMFYHYNVQKWLHGDPNQVRPSKSREEIRNFDWKHLDNMDVISMPDKWEYPWYATWDLAFHTISFAVIDPDFAKKQLKLFTYEWYMHPNGQLPAYEWNFDDVNPPVHAWAAFRVFKIDEHLRGKPDVPFLESIFQKLLLNFTWWVNKKDRNGNNIFEGGFLGLDNIGVFDRNQPLPNGESLEQADATSWMAMFALNMLRISLELAQYNPVYEEMATKFFEHFLEIAYALDNMGEDHVSLWDEQDEFFYDVIVSPSGNQYLKLRTIVGLIPLFAIEVIDDKLLEKVPLFNKRMNWYLTNRPRHATLVSHCQQTGENSKHLLSLVREDRLKKILKRVLNPEEFLSDYGIRALSKEYDTHPFSLNLNGTNYFVRYNPAESDSGMFGGNSNWRGPIWFPINFLMIESLERFHFYYGDALKVDCPYEPGKQQTLDEVAQDLKDRLSRIFLKDKEGKRAFNGQYPKFQEDPEFRDYILFYEYFHGDSGRGVGASHQTGWTGLIAKILHPRFSHEKS